MNDSFKFKINRKPTGTDTVIPACLAQALNIKLAARTKNTYVLHNMSSTIKLYPINFVP